MVMQLSAAVMEYACSGLISFRAADIVNKILTSPSAASDGIFKSPDKASFTKATAVSIS